MSFKGSHYSGAFTSIDLVMLQKVFEQLCKERRLARKDKDQRDDLATEIVRVFQQGIMSEKELWRALSKRRWRNREFVRRAAPAPGA